MIQKEIITSLVISKLADTRYFFVDVTVSADNVIKVEIDADEGVDIDFCVELNRFIEANFDREVEDYELEVGSAGLTSPFKVKRQYEKNLNKEVEVSGGEGFGQKGIQTFPVGVPLTEVSRLCPQFGIGQIFIFFFQFLIPFFCKKCFVFFHCFSS